MKDTNEIERRELDELFERYRSAPDSYVFVILADACRKIKRLEEALEICEQGVRRHPQYASGHVVKGKCLYDLGDLEEARRTFERVLTLDENNLVALKYLGGIDTDAGRYDSARERFQHILALDPDNPEIRASLRVIDEHQQQPVPLEASDPQAAHENDDSESDDAEFDTGKISLGDDIETSDDLATMTLADIFASQGYKDKARRIYQDLLRERPESELIRNKLLSVGGSLDEPTRSEPVETGEACVEEALFDPEPEDHDSDDEATFEAAGMMPFASVEEGDSQPSEGIDERHGFDLGSDGGFIELVGEEAEVDEESAGREEKHAGAPGQEAAEPLRGDAVAAGRGTELPEPSDEKPVAPGGPPDEPPATRPSRRRIDEQGNVSHFRRWLNQMKD